MAIRVSKTFENVINLDHAQKFAKARKIRKSAEFCDPTSVRKHSIEITRCSSIHAYTKPRKTQNFGVKETQT